MKRIFSVLLSLAMVFTLCISSYSASAANADISVYVDNQKVVFDVPPMLIGGRTMVPLRAIFDALGATTTWDAASSTVTSYNEAYLVKATIGQTTMYVNNEPVTIDIAPMIVESRTLVPARFVAEAFGCEVSWDANTTSVYIVTKDIDYNNVEQGTGTTPTPTPSMPTTSDNPIADLNVPHYPDTNIPDYGRFAAIDPVYGPMEEDGTTSYIYPYTTKNNYETHLLYLTYLEATGWTQKVYEHENGTDSYLYAKGSVNVFLGYDYESSTIFVLTDMSGNNTPSSSSTQQSSYSFTLVNNIGTTIFFIQMSPSTSDSWEEDLLGSNVLMNGASKQITLSGYEGVQYWDLRIKDRNDKVGQWCNLDMSTISKIECVTRNGEFFLNLS